MLHFVHIIIQLLPLQKRMKPAGERPSLTTWSRGKVVATTAQPLYSLYSLYFIGISGLSSKDLTISPNVYETRCVCLRMLLNVLIMCLCFGERNQFFPLLANTNKTRKHVFYCMGSFFFAVAWKVCYPILCIFCR